jgi:uncharacterized protein involved in cysteine biosynthesis
MSAAITSPAFRYLNIWNTGLTNALPYKLVSAWQTRIHSLALGLPHFFSQASFRLLLLLLLLLLLCTSYVLSQPEAFDGLRLMSLPRLYYLQS